MIHIFCAELDYKLGGGMSKAFTTKYFLEGRFDPSKKNFKKIIGSLIIIFNNSTNYRTK